MLQQLIAHALRMVVDIALHGFVKLALLQVNHAFAPQARRCPKHLAAARLKQQNLAANRDNHRLGCWGWEVDSFPWVWWRWLLLGRVLARWLRTPCPAAWCDIVLGKQWVRSLGEAARHLLNLVFVRFWLRARQVARCANDRIFVLVIMLPVGVALGVARALLRLGVCLFYLVNLFGREVELRALKLLDGDVHARIEHGGQCVRIGDANRIARKILHNLQALLGEQRREVAIESVDAHARIRFHDRRIAIVAVLREPIINRNQRGDIAQIVAVGHRNGLVCARVACGVRHLGRRRRREAQLLLCLPYLALWRGERNLGLIHIIWLWRPRTSRQQQRHNKGISKKFHTIFSFRLS